MLTSYKKSDPDTAAILTEIFHLNETLMLIKSLAASLYDRCIARLKDKKIF